MKKVLVINTTFDRGGAAMIARKIFFEAQKNGLDVWFASGRKAPKNERIFYFGNYFEATLHLLLVRFLGLEGYGSYFATNKLIRFIEKEKFDLIHIHNLHGYYINIFHFIKWLNKKGIQIIWTLHDEWLFTWLPAHSMGCKHCLGQEGECTNQYDYPKNYFPLFRKFMLDIKRELLALNIKFIAPSEWLLNKLKDKNVGDAVLINNGINLDLFKKRDKIILREKWNLPIDKKIVLFSAADLKNKNKGIKYVVETSEVMRDVLFLGIGEGSLESETIKVLGRLSDMNKLSEIHGLADLYFLSSLAESFSLSTYESLASFVPVVSFDLPVTKFIEENKCGKIAYSKEPKNIASVIGLVLEDENIEKMGENGRRVTEQVADEKIMLMKYIELYR